MSFKKEIIKFKNIISINKSPKFVTIKKIDMSLCKKFKMNFSTTLLSVKIIINFNKNLLELNKF